MFDSRNGDAARRRTDQAPPEVNPTPKINGNPARGAGRKPGSGRGKLRRQPPVALVAGGAGFLGSHLCDSLLADGYRVFCADNFHTGRYANVEHLENEPRFSLIQHDVRTPFPEFAGITQIYNLACPASPPHYQRDPIQTITTSVLGTLNLVELASKLRARYLLASTSEVYGDPEVHPQPETYRGCVSATGPRACYDEGKRLAETICYDYLRTNKADVRVARIFNTYGPRMRADDGRIISNFITQALACRPLTIYGSGEQTRSFCYVSDLVEGLRKLMEVESRPPGPINLGNPSEFRILDVADLVLQLTCSGAKLAHRPLPQDDPRRRCPHIGLAGTLLDWRPRVKLRDGLCKTIDWFKTGGRPRPRAQRTVEGRRASPELGLVRLPTH